MNIAQVYEDELREYLPIRFEGLTFHPLPVKRLALYQGIGMAQKGDHAPLTECFLRQLPAGIQKGLVTKMHPIKIP